MREITRAWRGLPALLVGWALLCTSGCGDDESTTPQPPGPNMDRPAPSRRFSPNRMTAQLQNHGSLTQQADGLFWFRDVPVIFDLGLWVGAHVDGQTRVSATSYFAPDFLPLAYGDSVVQVYVLTPGDGPGEPDYDAWPISAGAPENPSGAPLRLGTVTAWTAFDDSDSDGHTTPFHSAPLGAEVRETIWGFSQPDSALFVRYQLTNVSSTPWQDAYLGIWCDGDLGSAANDMAGYDGARSLGYFYTSPAKPESLWGAAQPSLGITLLDGPSGVSAFPLVRKTDTEPENAAEAYELLRGVNVDGQPFVDPTTQEVTRFTLDGDPVTATGWVETIASDKRALLDLGPLTIAPGQTVAVTIGIVCARNAGALASLTRLRAAVDAIRANPGLWDIGSTAP